ncbi:hypothetical protein Skr01_74550 [Sphaerisporangium krabiense]|uniref:RiboL-PSP-HEPN domain-containing protein n=1 Tax=Sphaerisporangium krabiense TaxID=763782 RepID=A0A7W9DQX1_9ACTN|nr:hypothetical protein [Sphaerisporangium krabiense]MBB5626830.1 hypothetical protein [Sphaerisporangium krabiense]GII67370.1 hypothetical protein Skr01_74550 [Sphaerisporangium krabiense]
MSWSLSRLKPREPELLDATFLSAGRALYLANAFESKCQFVLRISNLIAVVQDDPVLSLQEAISSLPGEKMLGPTLKELTQHALGGFNSEDIDVLDKARKARNFIAHEGVAIGAMWAARSNQILDHMLRLRAAVTDLAHGDNIISQWCHGIEEPKGPLPSFFIEAYPTMIDNWVFGHFGELLDVLGSGDSSD